MSRFEYCKLILIKISFNRDLLKKEYAKALRLLPESETSLFITWCKNEFGDRCEFLNT